jgi:hypothetical protein
VKIIQQGQTLSDRIIDGQIEQGDKADQFLIK